MRIPHCQFFRNLSNGLGRPIAYTVTTSLICAHLAFISEAEMAV